MTTTPTITLDMDRLHSENALALRKIKDLNARAESLKRTWESLKEETKSAKEDFDQAVSELQTYIEEVDTNQLSIAFDRKTGEVKEAV